MSALRMPCRSASLFVALVVLFPAAAGAQLKGAQDRSWSVLKDGYSLLASMCSDKGKRTGGNFESMLGKVLSSMADMSPFIDKMGERVADEDRGFAAGLRDNIKAAWKGVAEAHQGVRDRYDKAKENPEFLADLGPELEKLKAALDNYEIAFKAAYDNYKARWDEIEKLWDGASKEVKAAKAKVDALDERDRALGREEDALQAEWDKGLEEHKRIDKAVDDMILVKDAIKANLMRAFDDGNTAAYDRHKAEWVTATDTNHKIIVARLAIIKKMDDIGEAYEQKQQERARIAEETEAAVEKMAAMNPSQLFQRRNLWNAEFPGATYTFKTLK